MLFNDSKLPVENGAPGDIEAIQDPVGRDVLDVVAPPRYARSADLSTFEHVVCAVMLALVVASFVVLFGVLIVGV